MEDILDLWDGYSIQFCRTLEYTAHGDWSLLDEDEQEIAALWKLTADLYNGGFLQFFCNWGFPGYWYAMRGIQRMGNTALLRLLHNAYQLVFDKFKDDSRVAAYWDIPQYLSEEDQKILLETDTAFWDKEGEILAQRAYQFYCVTMEKTARRANDGPNGRDQ